MTDERRREIAAREDVYKEFLPFFGNNTASVPGWESMPRRGGGVSFKRHLGRPLTRELWEDLVERLGCLGLRVYGPNDLAWTMGFMPGPGAFIHLDENYLVKDIEVQP